MTANSQKVTIITGASSGIGKATKQLLRMNGHIVYNLDITADQEDDPALDSMENTSDEDFDNVIAVDIYGNFYTAKYVLHYMKAQRSGSIVFMGSDQSLVGKRNI